MKKLLAIVVLVLLSSCTTYDTPQDRVSGNAAEVYIEDEYGCYEYSDEVALPLVGLDEFNEASFSIYPNPAHETVTFSLNKLSNKTFIIFILYYFIITF